MKSLSLFSASMRENPWRSSVPSIDIVPFFILLSLFLSISTSVFGALKFVVDLLK
ncbi:hypothetical protein OA416_01965 [Paracoccaceae bacterium]|nr:hypothetical protein [Paracoccaceae bacterium]